VQVATGTLMESSIRATVPLAAALSKKAQTGHIFEDLTGSLISIGQLCDDDCIALFSKYHVDIIKDGKVIIKGKRNATNGLWNIPLAPKSSPAPPTPPFALHQFNLANSMIRTNKTKGELAAFLHGCAFSPSTSTFIRAIRRGHFSSWPGLSESLIKKHLPKSLATSKGHLRMQQQNLQSTKSPVALPLATSLDIDPAQEPQNQATNNVFAFLLPTSDIQKSYSDQTGRFPIQSSRGYQYVFILYEYDSNAILSKPLKTRQALELTTAWTELHLKLRDNGFAPSLHVLDNECSHEMKKAFTKHDVTFQLVPPHVHRRNAAERAIQTWKNHFCSGLATCDPKFPLSEWDLLMPQADLTLNLLRSSRRYPKLSAHACLNKAFNYLNTPLAPPGTRLVAHITPSQRANMAPHGVDGWYVGPSLDHYRCHKCYIPSTSRCWDVLTVDWFPHTVPFPTVTNDDYLRQTADDMLSLLQSKRTHQSPLAFGSTTRNAFIQIAQLLRRATQPPATAPVSEPRVVPAPPTNTPRLIPAAEMRVVHTPPPLLLPVPRTTKPRKAAKLPNLPPRPASRPPRPTTGQSRLSTRTSLRQTRQPSRYMAQSATHSAFRLKYAHHIAALVTTPVAGKQESLTKLLRGPDATTWSRSSANEWGRLLEFGIGLARPASERITGTGTIFFVHKDDVPADRHVSYANYVCNIRPQKTETHRVRMTAGGDQLDYPGDPSSPAVSMLDAKLHINSTISDAHKGARYFGIDIKNFYLGTPMKYFQYIRVLAKMIPQEVWDDPRYTPHVNADGFVYLEIRRGMYGLKEAGIIAFEQLVNKLAPHGYEPAPFTPGLWRHKSKPTTFTLCVDDFGIKYFSKHDAMHLVNALHEDYEITIDWTGALYCGLTLDWHYDEGYVDISMPGYVIRALCKFKHRAPKRPQHAPHAWVEPVYGSRQQQQPTKAASAAPLDPEGTLRVQQVNGTFMYYGRGVDPCILVALNEIASEQAKPTTDTRDKTDMLMDYLHTYPNAVIRFYASDMILKICSDAAYLVQPKARSRVAVHYHLGWKNAPARVNGAVAVLCQTLKNVVSSATEAETGGIYTGGRHGSPMIATLEEMGHKQPSTGTPFETDNKCAHGILNSKMRQKLSKAFDMRYWWMKDRIKQKQYDLLWAPGKLNLADYFTKHHPPWHHKKMRYKYIQRINRALSALLTPRSLRSSLLHQSQHGRVC
jgi:hypothetical protein